jgi:hypothetical protein
VRPSLAWSEVCLRVPQVFQVPFLRRALAGCCVLFIASIPICLKAETGALTLPQSLDQLTGEADTIVHGYVVSAKAESHPQLKNLSTIVVTMSVLDTLKGRPQKTLVFRQYVWDLRAQKRALDYRKGQELLLLLRPVSEYGLTSPVGLEQGRFNILHDHKGQTLATNGRGNVGLFQSTRQRSQAQGTHLSARTIALIRNPSSGPIPLPDLKEAIRNFVGTR